MRVQRPLFGGRGLTSSIFYAKNTVHANNIEHISLVVTSVSFLIRLGVR